MTTILHYPRYLFVWAFTALCVLPYGWMIATVFKRRLDITASPPKLWFAPTLGNLAPSYNGQNVADLLTNAFVIAGATAVCTVALGIPAAYYFARHRSPVNKQLFIFVLSTRIAPPIALSLPFYVLLTKFGLSGTHTAVITIHTVFNLSFVIWLLEGFFADIPLEVEAAAQVDGRSYVGAFFRVVLPLVRPGIGVAALFTFVFSWNEYMMASLLSSSETRPVTPSIPGFMTQATTHWGQVCVMGMLSSIPAILLLLVVQRYLARGFSSGCVRGV